MFRESCNVVFAGFLMVAVALLGFAVGRRSAEEPPRGVDTELTWAEVATREAEAAKIRLDVETERYKALITVFGSVEHFLDFVRLTSRPDPYRWTDRDGAGLCVRRRLVPDE